MPVRNDNKEDQWKKLFIGGLTYSTTDDMLKEFYSQWGEIVDCIVMKDTATKRSRGFGFVTYADAASVDDAMSNRPHIIDGKSVEPKRAIPRDMSGKPETNMSVKRLYVSGVREEHTDDMFREHFSTYGTVVEVDIITDKTTGKKRGFAFITFDDYDAVDKCVLQKSHMIDNKRCDVKKALSKEEIKKAEQHSRDRFERDNRSRGTSRGGGGGDWNDGGGRYGGGDGWNKGGGGGGGGGAWGAPSAGAWGGPSAGAWGPSGGGGGGGGGGYGGGYGANAGYPGGGSYGGPGAASYPSAAAGGWGAPSGGGTGMGGPPAAGGGAWGPSGGGMMGGQGAGGSSGGWGAAPQGWQASQSGSAWGGGGGAGGASAAAGPGWGNRR